MPRVDAHFFPFCRASSYRRLQLSSYVAASVTISLALLFALFSFLFALFSLLFALFLKKGGGGIHRFRVIYTTTHLLYPIQIPLNHTVLSAPVV
jgi:hypothetical protein